MFCLKCFHWWPLGSRFCGICQRPFNARLCIKDHANPLYGPQQSCNTCNQPLVQQGVPAIGMAWLAKALAVILLVWLGYQAVLHLGAILCVLLRAASWLLTFMLSHVPAWCYRLLGNLVTWWVCLYLLSYLLPKEMGGTLRGWLSRCGLAGVRFAGNGAAAAGKGIVALFQAATRQPVPKMTKTKRKGRSHDGDEEDGE